MAEKVLMIALSPTMESGTIVKWNKKEGDRVASGDLLCQVETDKATMDYEATVEGIMLRIVVPEGSSVKVGDLIAVVGSEHEDISAILGESNPRGGVSQKIEVIKNAFHKEYKKIEELEQGAHHLVSGVKASPLARELAAQKGIDLHSVEGSGPGGRITKNDIEKAFVAPSEKPQRKETPVIFPAQADRIVLSEKRRIIAERMSQSMFSAPHFYITVSVNVTAFIQARNQLNQRSPQKVSLNAFLIKFVAEALHRYPVINSSWDGDGIIKHSIIDIGLAVSQRDGLIVPVVRNCLEKGIITINDELSGLVQRAREGRLSAQEYTGGTFTISNLGSYGIRQFTAIINPPEAAILAVGEIFRELEPTDPNGYRVVDSMFLTLSCDHRIIDGAVGAEFMKDLKSMIENPVSVLY